MNKICMCFGLSVMLAAMISLDARAAFVVGGGGLMTQSYADQVQTWLGEGPITLTNIFTKQAGNTGANFHAAADGKGRTITLIEVLGGNYTTYSQTSGIVQQISTQVIGGYNPQSWNSNGSYNISPDSLRDAFIFNLTSQERFIQNTNWTGSAQTYNLSSFGPNFGGGFDIHTDSSLTTGYTNSRSYSANGTTSQTDSIISTTQSAYYVGGFQVGRIEVYTISAGSPAAVPEPATFALFGLGAVGFAVKRMRRKR
ncbi:PEP_CTERM-anchored TLD domain-containing protein [Pirellulaceae bacterium SH449]